MNKTIRLLVVIFYPIVVSGCEAFVAGNMTVTSVSASGTIATESKARVVFNTEPGGSVGEGASFTSQPSVEVTDSSGRPVAGASVSLAPFTDAACSVAGSGTLANAAATTGSSGIAAFTNLSYDHAQAIYLKATSGGMSACSSGSVLVLAQTYSQAVMADGPAGYWRLGESGATAADASGHGKTGTYHGPNSVVSSGILTETAGDATTFVSTSYVETTYTQTAVTAYTVEAWVNIPPTASGRQIVFQDRGLSTFTGMSLTVWVDAGQVWAGLDFSGGWTGRQSTAAFADGSWHQVAFTWSGANGVPVSASQFTIYIDGAEVGTTDWSGATSAAPLTGLGYATIGYHPTWSDHFDGSISDVAVYEAALSAARIAAHYHAAGY
jgi:hypothetical protein